MTAFGILGLGYLGQRLLPQAKWGLSQAQGFDVYDPACWKQIPAQGNRLLFTIPPERTANQARLLEWGAWMQSHRPQFQELIYISTTAVYPQAAGEYDESCKLAPDTPSGKIRLESEQALAQSFQLCALRCGGIYGPGRNLLTRLKEGKPLRSLDGPTHRIQVEDLTRLILQLLTTKNLPPKLTVVDSHPASAREVILWLQARGKLPQRPLPAAGPARQRTLSNAQLRGLPFSLRYPSYQEGYQTL